MAKHSQRIGAAGEQQAAKALHRIGVRMVEKIGTPVKLTPVQGMHSGVFRVRWGEKVSGDHRGVAPGGISVLAETKTILDRRLRWSDLRPHQPERLSQHEGCSGISLLVWVSERGIYIMHWHQLLAAGFGPYTSLSHATAERLNVETLERYEQNT